MNELSALDAAAVPLCGTTLIEASAGTGKTHTIATLFVRLLLEKNLRVSEILVVTYTRAATAELRQRIRQRVGDALDLLTQAGAATSSSSQARAVGAPSSGREVDEALSVLVLRSQRAGMLARDCARLQHALRSFDQAAILTIHGFCQRVLGASAFESGSAFDTELQGDQRSLLAEVVQDYWARELYDASLPFTAYVLAHVRIEDLLHLAARAAADPDLVVIPEAAKVDPSELLARWTLAHDQLCSSWLEQRTEVRALFTVQGRLKATIYKPERMQELWWPSLDRAREFRPAALPDWLRRLTPEMLGDGVRKGQTAPEHVFFETCARLLRVDTELSRAFSTNLLALQRDLFRYAREELNRRKLERGAQSFDDLLQRLRAAVEAPSGEALLQRLRATFPAALIDEFQDTDSIQSVIFQRIYDQRAQTPGLLFLIGDPKQAIYGFRGADVFAYMAAARLAGERSYTLSTNRRSDPGLLRAVNTLFHRAQAPFVFPEIRFHEITPGPAARECLGGSLLGRAPFEIIFMPRQSAAEGGQEPIGKIEGRKRVVESLAQEIVQVLHSGATVAPRCGVSVPVEPRHIAVLCRTNREALAMQTALRARSVPSVLEAEQSVFDSETAGELERLLAAMAEPSDAAAVRGALATSLLGMTGDDLLTLAADEAAWDDWLASFHLWHELWETRGLIQALYALFDAQGISARLLALPDGERRLTDLLHLSELLHAEALGSRLGPLSLLDFYRRACHDPAQRTAVAAESAQMRLESDARAVTLTTIHKSKGLEYPIVYCPFLWDGTLLHQSDQKYPRFHDPAAGDRMTLELAGADASSHRAHILLAERETLAESLRQLYVALTRAQHRVSVVWGGFRKAEKSALGYLLHQAHDESDATRPQKTAERIKELNDDQLLAELDELVVAASGAITVKRFAADGGERYRGEVTDGAQLRARNAGKVSTNILQTSSFTRLASQRQEPPPLSADEARERDDGHPETQSVSGEPAHAPERIALADFPAGTHAGLFIHELYETLDFCEPNLEARSEPVSALLASYGLPLAHADGVSAALGSTLRTLIDPEHGLPMLASVAKSERVVELEFVFPVAHPGGQGEASEPLTAARLSEVLRRHARTEAERGYAARVARLAFQPLCGFLRGFMDLVVRHQGRFYLLDYKSNHLGEHARDYRPERLSLVMERHHYVLQYLLYSVALHRHLGLRVAGYDYDQHFGGVYYLFVRGMAAEHALGTGVFSARPSRELIEALSELLRDPRGDA